MSSMILESGTFYFQTPDEFFTAHLFRGVGGKYDFLKQVSVCVVVTVGKICMINALILEGVRKK